MSYIPRNVTAYRLFVESNLPPIVRAGQGIYTVNELAAMVGLKPTRHFRKHVNHLALSGLLKPFPVFSPRGNIEIRFGHDDTDNTRNEEF